MIKNLRKIVEKTDTKLGLIFDLSIQALIIASIVIFSLETLPNLDPSTIELLGALEVLLVAVFSLEYLLRLAVAKHKIKFAFSFWGLIDLLAILPYYLFSFGINFNLIMLRAFRLLRLVRIIKLGRYSKSLARVALAMKLAKEDLVLALVTASIMLLVASFGIYQFENPVQPEKFSSVFESLWWALATLTTVGYGDIYPITLGGRIFTGVILMIGLGVVALPVGIISSCLTEARKQQEK